MKYISDNFDHGKQVGCIKVLPDTGLNILRFGLQDNILKHILSKLERLI